MLLLHTVNSRTQLFKYLAHNGPQYKPTTATIRPQCLLQTGVRRGHRRRPRKDSKSERNGHKHTRPTMHTRHNCRTTKRRRPQTCKRRDRYETQNGQKRGRHEAETWHVNYNTVSLLQRHQSNRPLHWASRYSKKRGKAVLVSRRNGSYVLGGYTMS